jgi:hypothetical protein
MIEIIDEFNEKAINTVRISNETLERWKHSSNPIPRAFARFVFLEAKGEI